MVTEKMNSADFNMFKAFDLSGEFDVVFDIGANIGMFSFYVLKNTKVSQVHLFEPNSDYSAVLRDRAQLLKLESLLKFRREGKRIYINDLALYSENKVMELFVNAVKPGTHSLIKEMVWEEGGDLDRIDRVETTTLDSYISSLECSLNNKQIFLKIDVEGVEDHVLNGATQLIKMFSPTVFVEVRGSGNSPTFLAIDRLMLDSGYQRYVDSRIKIANKKDREQLTQVDYMPFTHADVLYSKESLDISGAQCGYRILNRWEKLLRVIRRLIKLRLSDLHHLALRKPFDVFY